MLELEQLIRKFWANETTLAENQRLLQLLEQYRATVKDSMQENFQENEIGREHGLQPDKALSILQKIHGNLGIAGLAAGEFRMGSPIDEDGRDHQEGPMHRVRIAQPFFVGRYDVTVGEFAAFVKETGHDAGACGGRELSFTAHEGANA